MVHMSRRKTETMVVSNRMCHRKHANYPRSFMVQPTHSARSAHLATPTKEMTYLLFSSSRAGGFLRKCDDRQRTATPGHAPPEKVQKAD